MNKQSDISEQNIHKQGIAIKQLQLFIGFWNTEGITVDGQRLIAKDKYEWMMGGYFLLHKWNARIGPDVIQGIEIIGTDPQQNGYFTHSYDSLGKMEKYHADLNENIWKITGSSERFYGEFNTEKNRLSRNWELLKDGRWNRWMEIKLTKIE